MVFSTRLFKAVLTLVCSIVIVNCGSTSTSSDQVQPGFFEANNLAGAFQTECIDEDGESELRQLKAVGNEFWYRRLDFQGNGCNTEYLKRSYRRHMVGVQGVEPADIEGWQTFEWMLNSATLTIHQDWLVERYNVKKYFEKNDWARDQPHEISGLKSTPDSSKPQLSIGMVRVNTLTTENGDLLLATYSEGKTALRNDSPAYRYKPVDSIGL